MDKLLVVSLRGEFYTEYASLFVNRKISVKLAMTIQDALDMLSKDDYFTVVVDITYTENMNMIKVLRQSSSVPIIAYSKGYSLDDKRRTLRDGADEYFVFRGEFEEIYASIKALRRRYCEYGKQKKKPLNVLTLCGIIVCLNTRRVFIDGADACLSKKEFDILLYLIKNKYKALSYEQIFCEVWGGTYQARQINAVRCQIHRLSEKISPLTSPNNYIVNIKDYGYRINPELLTERVTENVDKPTFENKVKKSVLVVRYEGLVRMEHEANNDIMIFQKADTIFDALSMITADEYALIIINSDKSDYLLYINILRDMTHTPILVTTTNYDTNKKVAAIDNGADGYMLAGKYNDDSHETAKALIRRANEYNSKGSVTAPVISFGEILLDLNSRKTTVKGRDINLTRKEFDILRFILNQKGEIVTYEQICEHAWGERYDHGTYKPLMRLVYKIKEKIKIIEKASEYILNVREIGYRLNTEFDP